MPGKGPEGPPEAGRKRKEHAPRMGSYPRISTFKAIEGKAMIDLELHKTAIFSVESRGGRKQVWIHMGNRRIPLVNWADLEEEMSTYFLGPEWSGSGASCFPGEEGPSSQPDSSGA